MTVPEDVQPGPATLLTDVSEPLPVEVRHAGSTTSVDNAFDGHEPI